MNPVEAGAAIDGAATVLQSGDSVAIVGLIGITSIGAIVVLVIFALRTFSRIAAKWNESTERIVDRSTEAHQQTAREGREAIESLRVTTGDLATAIATQTAYLKAPR